MRQAQINRIVAIEIINMQNDYCSYPDCSNNKRGYDPCMENVEGLFIGKLLLVLIQEFCEYCCQKPDEHYRDKRI